MRTSRLLFPALCLLVLAGVAGSVATGVADIALWPAASDAWHGRSGVESIILTEVRLPRALLGALVGAALGCAGAALQGLLRNPLAGPDLIGVSNGAALGAVIAIYFGLATLHPWSLPLMAMSGAAVACLLMLVLAGREADPLVLILAGVAINAIAGAMTAMALAFAPSPYAINEMVHWLLGSLANRSRDDLAIAAPLVLLGLLLLLRSGRFLNALVLGEDTARSLGFNAARERWGLLLGVTTAVGAAVSVTGSIGFVGLVVPHWLRPLVGYEPARLLPASALGGAILVLAADIAVQQLSPQGGLKIGVLTALIGGPFFLHLVFKTRGARA